MTEQTAYIGLGSNLGDRDANIKAALKKLAETEGIKVLGTSDVIETVPLAGKKQQKYLNAVAEIKTSLSAEALLKNMLDIETSLGRKTKIKWSSRTIDLDLLLFGDEVISMPDLTVPHPQLHLRSFVLKGLCQLNGRLVHPVIKEPMSELARRVGGADFALNPDAPQLINVSGIIGVGKTTLAKQLSDSLGCELLLEAYDTNPFLPQVYAGKKELALDSQLYFLTTRIEQLKNENLTPEKIAVSDYVFDKELIYARRLLDNQQLDLYESINLLIGPKAVKPVLVIYLTDSAQRCLERIHNRNRPYEQRIKLQFLERLSADYEQLFARWKTCPVIRLSMSEFDCRKNEDLQNLANQLKYYLANTTTDRKNCL